MINSTEENLIEKFKAIKTLLSKKELPITSSLLSKQFHISLLESSALLNEFILNEECAVEQYIIYFLIEQIENEGITMILLSNIDSKLESVLTDSRTVSFSAFAIMNKTNDFSLDYGSLAIPNDIECRFDFNAIKIDKPSTVSKGIVSTSKGKVEQLNNDMHSKLNVDDQDDENMYQGFNPNKQENKTKSKRKASDSVKVNQHKKVTKSSNSSRSKSPQSNEVDHHKGEPRVETKSDIEEQEQEYNEDNSSDVQMKNLTSIDNQTDIAKNGEGEDNAMNQPNKVLKKRKVKKTIQKLNEKGYMITEDEWVEEEYWEEESRSIKNKSNGNGYNHMPNKSIQPNRKPKKLASGQSSLFSFLK